MPELPEVEVLRRDLDKEIVGRRIRDVEVRPGSNAMKIIKRHGRRKEFVDLLTGARVDGIGRAGKKVLLELDNGRVLVIDVGTSLRLSKSSSSDDTQPHTHVVIGFTIGGQLRIIDPKLTGEVFVATGAEIGSGDLLRTYAVDPIANQMMTWQEFSTLLEQHPGSLKETLVDDTFVCGLGDIYSDEVLFTAGLRYDRRSDALSSQDVRRLYRALIETLHEAIKARGTTWGDHGFRDLTGNRGAYQLELKVYEREGQACRRCRSPIVREAWEDGRHTYLCPQCQS